MSEDFKDFVNQCTTVDPDARPSATQLLKVSILLLFIVNIDILFTKSFLIT